MKHCLVVKRCESEAFAVECMNDLHEDYKRDKKADIAFYDGQLLVINIGPITLKYQVLIDNSIHQTIY